jgi:hypothetical protein
MKSLVLVWSLFPKVIARSLATFSEVLNAFKMMCNIVPKSHFEALWSRVITPGVIHGASHMSENICTWPLSFSRLIGSTCMTHTYFIRWDNMGWTKKRWLLNSSSDNKWPRAQILNEKDRKENQQYLLCYQAIHRK